MDKLILLQQKCECKIELSINPHTTDYETPEQWLQSHYEMTDEVIEADIRNGIISTGTIIDLCFYPRTPVGFHRIIHFDLLTALDLALATFE